MSEETETNVRAKSLFYTAVRLELSPLRRLVTTITRWRQVALQHAIVIVIIRNSTVELITSEASVHYNSHEIVSHD